MPAAERLQLALLVRRDDVLVGPRPLALEDPRVQIEHPPGLDCEVGIALVDPALLLPGLERIFVQPPPDRRGRRLADRQFDHQPVELSAREPAQRQPVADRQLARDRLDRGDLLRGENGAGDPRAVCPSDPQAAARRTSSPPPDQTRRAIKPGRDLRVMQTLGRIQNDPRALHILKRQLLRPRTALQLHALLLTKHDPMVKRATHQRYITSPPPAPLLPLTTDTSGRVY
jgi:hypothetical protein